MTDPEIIAALDVLAVQVDDARWGPRIVEARRAIYVGDWVTGSDFFFEVIWAAYMGGGALYRELRDLGVEIARRRPEAHPVDFEPPYRYGSIAG